MLHFDRAIKADHTLTKNPTFADPTEVVENSIAAQEMPAEACKRFVSFHCFADR